MGRKRAKAPVPRPYATVIAPDECLQRFADDQAAGAIYLGQAILAPEERVLRPLNAFYPFDYEEPEAPREYMAIHGMACSVVHYHTLQATSTSAQLSLA